MKALQAAQIGGPKASVFDDIRSTVSEIGALKFDMQAALYWIGSAAEHAVLERVPGMAKEEFYNTGLVRELEGVVEKMGCKLFESLGYTSGFLFEVAFWETDSRADEADTGADMCRHPLHRRVCAVCLDEDAETGRRPLLPAKLGSCRSGRMRQAWRRPAERLSALFSRRSFPVSISVGRRQARLPLVCCGDLGKKATATTAEQDAGIDVSDQLCD
ncbi:hypothetical protein [Rhizobium etli]|uniref:hypothetical protein n=1 Tax=Rhizobium etli TaxID=29449 RepID=UPI0012BBBDFF|nr:hypothetical protein [Rhizobium etli]